MQKVLQLVVRDSQSGHRGRGNVHGLRKASEGGNGVFWRVWARRRRCLRRCGSAIVRWVNLHWYTLISHCKLTRKDALPRRNLSNPVLSLLAERTARCTHAATLQRVIVTLSVSTAAPSQCRKQWRLCQKSSKIPCKSEKTHSFAICTRTPTCERDILSIIWSCLRQNYESTRTA